MVSGDKSYQVLGVLLWYAIWYLSLSHKHTLLDIVLKMWKRLWQTLKEYQQYAF